MRQIFALLVLLGIAFSTTACIVEEPGHERGCFWHPCR
jgi:hypothetical protein